MMTLLNGVLVDSLSWLTGHFVDTCVHSRVDQVISKLPEAVHDWSNAHVG
jgi:hypothetical protein